MCFSLLSSTPSSLFVSLSSSLRFARRVYPRSNDLSRYYDFNSAERFLSLLSRPMSLNVGNHRRNPSSSAHDHQPPRRPRFVSDYSRCCVRFVCHRSVRFSIPVVRARNPPEFERGKDHTRDLSSNRPRDKRKGGVGRGGKGQSKEIPRTKRRIQRTVHDFSTKIKPPSISISRG